MNQPNKIKRNVAIYVIGVLCLATMGGVITATVNAAGMLLLIISPILMMVLLRFFGGDGWQDAGLGLNFKESWRWYLFSLFVYPITITLVIGIGVSFGLTTVNRAWQTLLPVLIAGMATQLLPKMLFALFEEWGWRGYLEPRLAALAVPDSWRHLCVGLIWALWHFPLILATPYTALPYALFFPPFVLAVILSAIVYGQLRKASGTVWTAVLMHGIGNTFGGAILQLNFLTINDKLLANFTPESMLSILLWSALAWWMLSRRKA